MSVGKLSSYFTKRRDAASAKEPEEGSDKRQQTSSVRARLEKKLQVKQKTGFAFNFDLVGDEDGLEEGGGGARGGGSTEREAFRFGFNPTESPGDVGTSVRGQQRRSGGDADPRGDDDFAVHVSGASTAARSAKKKGKRKGGGKKKKGGKGKGKGAGNSDRHPAENELNRERDEAIGSPTTKDAAIVMPPPAVDTNEGCQSDGNFSLEVGNDSSEGTEPSQQQPGTGTLGLAQDAGRMESSPAPVVARPPPGLTLESWKDPALTGEERRRRRFGRGVRNMAAIQRSRDARRGAGVGAADLAAEEEFVPDSSSQGGLAKPGADRARGESSRASGSSVFAFGFDIGISFNEGS